MARPARRLIRILAASVAALLLLVIAAVAALLLFVDADRFRPRIERAASQSLGRQVSLGSLHWDPGRRIALSSACVLSRSCATVSGRSAHIRTVVFSPSPGPAARVYGRATGRLSSRRRTGPS